MDNGICEQLIDSGNDGNVLCMMQGLIVPPLAGGSRLSLKPGQFHEFLDFARVKQCPEAAASVTLFGRLFRGWFFHQSFVMSGVRARRKVNGIAVTPLSDNLPPFHEA
ncbi:MAG: hypothetical protein U0872_12940 [Planctomycetaceae bacterium]